MEQREREKAIYCALKSDVHVPVRAYLTIGLATGIFTPIHTVLFRKRELYRDLFCHNICRVGEVLSLAMVHRV